MYYGLKLSWPQIAGAAEWRRLIGEPEAFAGRLRECGLSFLELPLSETSDYDAGLKLAERLKRYDLFLSFHPYYDAELATEIFDPEQSAAGLQALFTFANDVAAITGVTTPLIFHGGQADKEPHRIGLAEATRNAKSFFHWAGQRTQNAFPRVRILCETQMLFALENAGPVRVGDTYETCLDLVEGTTHRVCWDFGHTFRGGVLGKHAATPPPEFLARVGHVHAHETIRRDGELHDHHPLGRGICPWQRYLGLLAETGYNGTILFEIMLETFASAAELFENLRFATHEVAAIFQTAKNRS
jgi:sugar phosphate isomerase/epimerase